jgi:hypothetical protein
VANPNLELLVGMAQALGPLCERVVFVGGCATGLLLPVPNILDVRPTEDVDGIVEVATLAGYHALAEELQQQGFRQTMEDNTPPFRWFWQRMQLDLVPLDEKVLGFANRWYRAGFDAAVQTEVAPGLVLRHLSAPYFLATKFEAFNDRGRSDVYTSHDLEDILTVVEGRAELELELSTAATEVRQHVMDCVAQLLANPDFNNALAGLLSQPDREPLVRARLQQLTVRAKLAGLGLTDADVADAVAWARKAT